MPDRWAVLLAVGSFAGAQAAVTGRLVAVPLIVAATVAIVAVAIRRPALLCLGVAALAAALAQRSLDGLDAPTRGDVRGEVTLVGDPVPDGRGGVEVDVRREGRRLLATARDAAAAALDDRLAGEHVMLIGEVDDLGPNADRFRHRHLAGRLRVEVVVGWRPGHAVTRVANGLRRTLEAGAAVVPERQRSLLLGLTLGDDRHQPADMADAFRGAGLTHLLAVSGQNVAFALALAAPLLTRLRLAPRLIATVVVLAGFGLLTRFEPSVLRAAAMAGLAATGAALGRPASTLRVLALGVTGLLLIDPLLVSSLGFRLSVAGAGGIVVGARRIEAVLPGPRWLATPLAVTLAAQAAVAPLLVTTFGSLPVASLPANLMAVPAAGPAMMWGLTAGLVAGVAPPVAGVLHVATRALVGWIDAVAAASSRWPLGELRSGHLVLLVLSALAVLGGRRLAIGPAAGLTAAGRLGVMMRTSGVIVAGLVVTSILVPSGTRERTGPTALGPGATAWSGGGATAVVLDGRASAADVFSGLRDRSLRRVDVIVVRTDARSTERTLGALRSRWPRAVVLAPRAAASTVAPASSPSTGDVIDVGGLRLAFTAATADHLAVEIARRP